MTRKERQRAAARAIVKTFCETSGMGIRAAWLHATRGFSPLACALAMQKFDKATQAAMADKQKGA